MHNMPEVDESKKSIRFAIVQTLGLTFLVIVGILLFSRLWINRTIENEKAAIQSNLIQIMTLVRNSIEPDLVLYRNHTITRDEARDAIKLKLKKMIYKDKYGDNYIFMTTYEGYILVQPYQPWLENTYQWNMQDINGVYLAQGLYKTARENKDGGFFTYYYKPPNLQIPEEKLTYVIDVPEIECIMGTGMYMRLYYEDQTTTIRQITFITILLACLVLIITLFGLQRIRLTGKNLEKEIIRRGEYQQKLAESESNLRTVFNSISDSLIIHSAEGTIIEINNRVLDMFGCQRDQIIGGNVEKISAPGEYDQNKLDGYFKQAFADNDVLFEYQCRRLDTGEKFFVEVALRKANWYGQNVVLALVRDIQKRKYIERELTHSQMINEQAEEFGMFGHYFIDMESRKVSWSKGLYKIFGHDTNLPAPDFDEYETLIVPEDVEKTIRIRKEARKKYETTKMEYRIQRPNGEIRDLIVQTNWLSDGTNSQRYLIGSIQDLTEMNRAIREIKQNEEKFRTTMQQMSDGLILIDESSIIIEWNAAQEKLTNMKADNVLGKHVWDVFPKLGITDTEMIKASTLQKEILRTIETGESQFFSKPIEVALQQNDGSKRFVLLTMFPIKSSSRVKLGLISHDISEQKASLDKVNHELEKLASLRSIDASILERSTPEKTLQMVCSIAVKLLGVDASIIVAQISKDELTTAFKSLIDTPENPVIGELLQLQLATIEKLQVKKITPDILKTISQINQIDENTGETLHQVILPIIMNRKTCGYIQTFSRKPIPDDQEWNDYFVTLAGQTSLANENVTLITNEELAYNELNHAYEATIAGWSKALELRDEETKGHSDRVMFLACKLARRAGLPHDKMTSFRRGVLLHDIGKMGIPDRILLKPGPLTEDEWKIMKQHPGFAYDLLSTIPYLHDSLEVPFSHHERWDGSGYPQGLKGEEIPLAARIFAIVDVWDALISDRPYRNGWEPEKIKEYLLENKGKQFDPELVELFLDMIQKQEAGIETDEDKDCVF